MKRYGFLLLLLALGFLALNVEQGASPQETPAVEETATLAPEETMTPTTPEQGREITTATETPTPSPTPERMPEGMTATPDWDLSNMRVWKDAFTSPDGHWVAERVIALAPDDAWASWPEVRPVDYFSLSVRSADGRVERKMVDAWKPSGEGWTYPEIVRWSKDGRSLYYTEYPVAGGCPLFFNGSGLFKVDLESGAIYEILPVGGMYLMALSPDEKALAYTAWDNMVLRDLATGEERKVPMGALFWRMVWSPDSRFLAVTFFKTACVTLEEEREATSLWLVDAQTLEKQVIFAEDPRRLMAEEWTEKGHIVLRDPEGRRWLLNVVSRAIMLEENTPVVVETPASSGCNSQPEASATP